MLSRKRLLAGAAVVSVSAVTIISLTGIPAPVPNPPGTFAFAALGDAPYVAMHGETLRYRLVLRDLEAHDLDLVLHVGDIFWYPCTDERYRQTLDELNQLRHPVIYTPGDNEWTDCWEEITGRFEPLDRLASLRRIFFATPTQSLGRRRIALATQSAQEPFKEFVENVRWAGHGLVFVTVNLPGSANARERFPGRTAAHDQAATRRTEAAVAWLREAFAAARASDATGVVVGFHANPSFEAEVNDEYRQSFEPFLAALEEEAEGFGKPVLVAQGDNHDFIVDRPLLRRTTGRRLDNLTRLQVPGSSDIGWVKVVVTPGPPTSFAFENRVVPAWKLW
jgi:hypothetical protein